jgi:hypothetical protein
MTSRKFLMSLCILSALGSAGAAVWAQSGASAGSAGSSDAFVPPRTPWGDPDLQGVWDYRTITPLERPAQYGDREYYSDEEIAELEGKANARMENPPDENTPANLVHAQYMTDPGTKIDESHRTSLIIDPKNGRMPELTATAQQARGRGRGNATVDPDQPWRARSMLERCITYGMPNNILPGLYNNNIEIVQGPDHVAIIHEMVHDTRMVPLDGSDFSGVGGYLGESRGHWEGNTLVVETRNFNGETSWRGAGGNLRLTERYTLIAKDRIDFRMTIEDDTQWVRPFTVAYLMRPTEGQIYEYACHEGNYGLRNILENQLQEASAGGGA